MADRNARRILLASGLLLFAAGVLGLVRSFGGFGRRAAREALITDATRDWVMRNDRWFWPLVAALAALLALSALASLRHQLGVPAGGSLVLEQTPAGRTTVRTEALAAAVAGDLEAHRAVERAKVRIDHARGTSRLAIRLLVSDRIGADEVASQVVGPSIDRVQRATGDEIVTADVVLGYGEAARRIE